MKQKWDVDTRHESESLMVHAENSAPLYQFSRREEQRMQHSGYVSRRPQRPVISARIVPP